MLEETHRSHQGLQACLQGAREVFFWPGMSAQLKELIDKCSICQSVKPEQASEPLQPHPVPDRPWQRVASDLFTFANRNYLVLVDYFSNFIELDYLRDTSSLTVIRKLKMHFARHGVPNCLVFDNSPQYISSEFRRFAATWKFKHVTISPHYPQANGMAESAVKTCKSIMEKSFLSKSDPYLGLLDHRKTPTAATGMSPCQRLFGRRTKTLLPLPESLLKTDKSSQRDRVKQAKYFDQHSKQLSELKSGDLVRMKLPGKTQWSRAVVTSKIAPRSYKVEANGRAYRRNHKQLRSTKEPLQEATREMDEDDHINVNPLPEKTQPSQVAIPNAKKQTAPTPLSPQPPYASHTPEKSERTPQVPITSGTRSRYGRLIKPPKKFDPDSYK